MLLQSNSMIKTIGSIQRHRYHLLLEHSPDISARSFYLYHLTEGNDQMLLHTRSPIKKLREGHKHSHTHTHIHKTSTYKTYIAHKHNLHISPRYHKFGFIYFSFVFLLKNVFQFEFLIFHFRRTIQSAYSPNRGR